ncbi:LPXTG cell wall anchor domain-containing protein [Dactylosporangium darangshiense]|uniref:Gram-positive cocci surface proteins LPxTG domain-containing protein n=1 Tax=Dactylosporangium darangshiense TaxID=579108 RepID=A0ABP8DGB4_9ACTN
MKPARTNQPYVRLVVLFAAVFALLLAGAPAHAVPSDDGMPITVVVSGSPEPSTSPTPGGGGGGLPRTGLNIILIAGVGAGLVALGAVVLIAARRRRAVGAQS